MKQRLAEFFPLSDKELHHLWEYSTFVFDTNVLLGLYRLPRSAREEYIAVIKSLRDRVWIPHHVALEFNLRRPRVIAQQRKLIENRTAKISDNLADALREVNDLFPCLAIGIPAPAATNAAAVEMLNVVTVPPPVPAVSTNLSGSNEMIRTMALRRARIPPAISL